MTKKQPPLKTYMDLLRDEHYLQWRIMPSKKLDEYWTAHISDNPSLNDDIKKADVLLKQYIAEKNSRLSEKERRGLYAGIQKAVRRHGSALRRKSFYISVTKYAAVALLAILVGVGFFITRRRPLPTADPEVVVVGSRANPEEILLISGNEKTVSFAENVEIIIGKEGAASIKNSRNGDTLLAHIPPLNKLIVPYGKRSSITLSDGSKVWLNSGSAVEFPSAFRENSREISILGEVYIEVEPHEKPFIVHTPYFHVNVYGTKFNVSAYNEDVHSVVLVEGKVAVRTFQNKEVRLNPGQMCIVSENRQDVKSVDVDGYVGWKNGYLKLDDIPIEEVLRIIGRYYNIRFDLAGDLEFSALKCKGKILLSDNLDDTMQAISLLSSTSYVRRDNSIQIRKNTQ